MSRPNLPPLDVSAVREMQDVKMKDITITQPILIYRPLDGNVVTSGH